MHDATPKPSSRKALRITLAASLDPAATTEALRLYFGIVETVWAREKGEDGIAYLTQDHVTELSGVSPKTVSARHLDAAVELGVTRESRGHPRTVVDEHGMASSWFSSNGSYKPMDVARLPYNPRLFLGISGPSGEGTEDIEDKGVVEQSCNTPYVLESLAKFFFPGAERWMQHRAGSSGWRLALILVALFGLERTPVNASELGRVLGRNRSTATRAFQRLAEIGLTYKTDKQWVWDPQALVIEIEHLREENGYLLDNRPHRRVPGLTREWKEARQRWIDERREEPLPYGRPFVLSSRSTKSLDQVI